MADPADPNGILDASHVPIVGQPAVVKAWFPTVVAVCNCSSAPEPLLLVGVTPFECPKCKRKFLIGGIEYRIGKDPKIQLGMVTGSTLTPQ